MKMNRTRGTRWWLTRILLVLVPLVLAMTPATTVPKVHAAVGGPVFLSGDDADDSDLTPKGNPNPHCQFKACGNLYAMAMKKVHDKSTSEGTGIVAIGANSAEALKAFNSWNDKDNNGPGAAVTHCNDAACFQDVDFSHFKMIYIASVKGSTVGGLTADQLSFLNSKQEKIVDFVNNLGGGLMALTEKGAANQYGWLPVPLTTADLDHPTDEQIDEKEVLVFRPTSAMDKFRRRLREHDKVLVHVTRAGGTPFQPELTRYLNGAVDARNGNRCSSLLQDNGPT